ncbi:hypothetical protein Hanom_Chr13g01197731 [Helianthus anomalus]
MHKEWDAFEASKQEVAVEKSKVVVLRANLEADQAKFEGSCRDEARSHRERSEQREVHSYATLALRNKEIEELTSLLNDQEQTKAELESAKKDLHLKRVEKAEATRRLTETEEKDESSETAKVTVKSLIEPLKNDMLWMQHHGIINVANSILNSIDLDQTVANLMVIARSDMYTQGYAECTQHVTNALMVDWDNSRSATRGVDTSAHVSTKEEYNNLRLPVIDLVTTALQSENFVEQLKEIFPAEVDASDEEVLD